MGSAALNFAIWHMYPGLPLAVPEPEPEVKLLTEIQHLLKGNVARAVRPSVIEF